MLSQQVAILVIVNIALEFMLNMLMDTLQRLNAVHKHDASEIIFDDVIVDFSQLAKN